VGNARKLLTLIFIKKEEQMEQSKFINILRKVIKEEIRSVIKQELTEILQEGLKSTINDMSTKKSITSITESPVKSSKNKVQFKENKFAAILNETDRLTENKSAADYKNLMTEDIVMTSKNAQGFGIQRNMQETAIIADPETGKTLSVDPIIQKAMTRDYSALMKAIDNKKQR
jgi:hypothetical protein